jgi:ParB family chromosome partitioning protein
MNVSLLPIEKLVVDPNNPRKDITKESVSDLAASIKAHSVKVPLIAYMSGEGVLIADGHRRLEAARLAGLREVPVIVLPSKPSEADILSAQLTINGHREALNPLDEFQAFSRLMQLKGCSPSELAATLAISGPEVTRVLSLGKLSRDEQQLVREGRISKSAAYALSRIDAEQRAALLPKVVSGQITRDQLDREARRAKKGDNVKQRRVSFAMPGGMVSLQAEDGLSLQRVIETLEGLLRDCRKYKSQGLDVSTAVRVAKDQSRASPAA